MSSYSHTLSVRRENRSPLKSCSFKSHPMVRGRHWDLHKGYVREMCGERTMVVKVSTDQESPSAQVSAEVDKFRLAESVLQGRPDVAWRVRLAPTYRSSIDKVGRGCKLQKKLNGNAHNGNLQAGGKVVVQEWAEGRVQRLFLLGEGDQQTVLPADAEGRESLLALIHDSYSVSNGECVISGVKGVVGRDDRGRVTYHVTSLTINSRGHKYGEKDQGEAGLEAYRNWSGIAHRVQPTAPPQACPDTPDGLVAPALPTAPLRPPVPKFYVTPVPASEGVKASFPRNSSSQLLNALCSDSDLYKELLERAPELRNILSAKSMTKLLDLPPSYSFTGA